MHDLKKIFLDSLETSSIKDDSTYRLRSKDITKLRSIEPVNENPLNLDGKRVFVWSDTHFYHTNIIEFCARPFYFAEEMNNTLLHNYNTVVREEDVCIWVGDVGLGPKFTAEGMNEILDNCNGYKILIVGNHDIGKWNKLNFDEKYVIYNYKDFIFTHYPWETVLYGFYNIHGHIHANPQPNDIKQHPRLFNVNCEFHEYRPIPLTRIVEHFST